MATALDVEHPPPIMNLEDLFDIQLFDPNILPDAVSSASHPSPNSPDFLSYSPSTPPQLSQDALVAHNDAQDPNLDPMLFYEMLTKEFGGSGESAAAASMGIHPSAGTNAAFPFVAGAASATNPITAFPPQNFTQNIDPSLVAASGTTVHHEDSHADSDSEDDFEIEPDEPVIKPVKVGGKGKARKGTVASGGVMKRTAGTSAPKEKAKAADEEWRPSPEEYKKMSSKEKRQLRNKISARNFRVRRKEYINTLEGDVAERDLVIEAIRDELSSTRLENIALRQEVEALKRAMIEGRASIDDLPPPAPLPPTPPSASSPTLSKRAPSTRSSSTALSKPNTQKDLPTSPRVNGTRTGFWGGSSAPFTGGITSVHATLIPEFKLPSPPSSVSSPDSPSSSSSSASSSPPPATPEVCMSDPEQEQENINPMLNLPCFGGVGATTPNPKFPLSPFQQNSLGSNFDAFAETNPFTLKSLDAYRMQLWGRMAREAGRRQVSQQQPPAQQPAQNATANGPYVFSPLTSALRPAYFTGQAPRDPAKMSTPSTTSSSHGSGLAALLAGKPFSSFGSSSSSSSPPSSSLLTPPMSPTPSHASLGSASPSPSSQPTQTQALLAGLATQTLLSKLSGAFWDAFAARPAPSSATAAAAANGAPSLASSSASTAASSSSSSSSSSASAAWDHDKVRRVLEGKAVVTVVDVEHDLEKSMKAMSIGEKDNHGQSGSSSAGGLVGGWRKYASAVSGAERK